MTIGQTATPETCTNGFDRLQPTVTSGNTYVAPAAGTITSWSTQANAGGGKLTMKFYRPLGGTLYLIVGHDGPRDLIGGALNTFSTSIAVKAGDVLGNHTAGDFPGCYFVAAGERYLSRGGDLADGTSGDFSSSSSDRRLNITAVLDPTNTFSLGQLARNKKKGTATLTINDIPNAGELTAAGKGAKVAGAAGAFTSKTVTPPGPAQLLIKAKGKKKRKLNETGKVKLELAVTFTPTGGDPNTQSRKVKLKKR